MPSSDQELIPFCGDSRPSVYADQGQQRNINRYPVIEGDQVYLYPTPGMDLISTVGSYVPGEGCRGIYTFEGVGYCVMGKKFYSFDINGTATFRGNLRASTNPVVMSCNGNQIFVTDGITAYNFDLGNNSWSEVTDYDYDGGSTHSAYISGFTVVTIPGSDQFALSNALDSGSWEGNIASAEASGDYLVAPLVANDTLFLIGTETTEQYRFTGAADFPLEKIDGSIIEYGCAAPYTIAKTRDSFVFLAKNKNAGAELVQFRTGTIKPILNQYYTDRISRWARVDDAIGFSYVQSGHEFYVLTSPSADVTFVYDFTTEMCHERSSYLNMNYRRWRPTGHIFMGNKQIVGVYDNNNLYELKLDYYTEYGSPIKRVRRSQLYNSNNNQLTVYKFQINYETDYTNTDGTGDTPVSTIRYSTDGGHTWSNDLTSPIGSPGNFNDQAIWHCLGSGRKWVVEEEFNMPYKSVILGATARYSIESDQ